MMFVDMNQLTEELIGVAFVIHRSLGKGLQEAAYQEAFCRELRLRGIPFECQLPISMEYKDIHLASVYRVEMLVARAVVVKVKAVETLTPMHEGQLLLDLWLGGWNVGLLINFDAPRLQIHQKVLEADE
jgi:GxxExxY protein